MAAPAAAMEEIKKVEKVEGDEKGEWWIVLLLTAAVPGIVDICSRFGMEYVKGWFKGRDELKVKRLHENAVIPQRGTEGSRMGSTLGGREGHSSWRVWLGGTGLAVELPLESYGRIAGRSGLATRGIDVGAGVVDRDYRGEVKILIRNLIQVLTTESLVEIASLKSSWKRWWMFLCEGRADTIDYEEGYNGGFGSTDSMRGATSFSLSALRRFSVCGGRRREIPEGHDDTSLDPRDDRRQYHRVRGAGWVPPLTSGLEGLMGASEYPVRDFTQR